MRRRRRIAGLVAHPQRPARRLERGGNALKRAGKAQWRRRQGGIEFARARPIAGS
jgi:hypothetical protein